MKMRVEMSSLVLCVCLSVILVVSCGKKETEYENASSSIKPEGHLLGSDTSSEAGTDAGVTAGDLESLDYTGDKRSLLDTNSEEYRSMYGRSTAPLFPVFFNFDSSSINDDQIDKLNMSGNYLLEERGVNVIIEGNTDARGSADYNLALGELRAINVKKYLLNLGVSENRITTISYGLERPLYPGSDEFSWSMNRRADLVLP